ncbi:MAG: carboxypeptidase-like regulatory domain-containing protein [Myxococcota bacterium]|nr:carboxypeptidase-like regulatory domain-containing protein [Myxococcota bacterium]
MTFRSLALTALPCWMIGCVTAGPMPAATFTTSTPDPRAQLEVSAALSPGYYVTDAVVPLGEERTSYGTVLPQVSGFVDPGRLLGELGVSIGARAVGGAAGYLEPMVRYRRSFGEERRFGLALTAGGAYGHYSDPERPPLELSLLKGTLEAAGDLRLTPLSWVELHAIGGGALTALAANGRWCASPATGLAVACPTEPRTAPILVGTGSSLGLFPAAYAGLAVDLGRTWTGIFHLLRLSAIVAGGNLPKVSALPPTTLGADTEVAAGAAPRAWWGMWGLSLTIALGQGGPERDEPVTSSVPTATPPKAPGTIRGRVMEGETPVAGVVVRSKNGAQTTTGPDGWFELPAAGPGVVELEVAGAGFRVANEAVHVPVGGQAELSVRLVRAILPPLATVRGEVRSGGRAAPGVSVAVLGDLSQVAAAEVPAQRAEVLTDHEGRFELQVPQGEYRLQFSKARYVRQVKTLSVQSGEQALFFVELAPAADF